MRLLPILTALVVAAVLYGFVMERDRLMDFARSVAPAALLGEAETTPEAPTASADAAADVAQAAAPAEGVVRVMVARSVAKEVDSAVILRGETEALREVEIRAETSGRVISDPLRKGSFVETGDTICKLDPGTREAVLAETQARLAEARARRPEVEARIPEAEARLEEARARLEEAQINANAAESLSQDGFASQSRVANTRATVRSAEAAVSAAQAGLKSAQSGLESLSAGVESAQAAVAQAEREIERLTIAAPFAGLLESDTAELGSLLQPGGACATIIQLDPIKLVGFVPETDIGRVETGARAGARLVGGAQVMGDVTFVSRSADPVTRTFRIEITVDNDDLAIRDGQTAEIAIEAEGAPAHLLPQSALTLNDEGTLGVRTVTAENTVLFRAVDLVRDTRDGVLVTGLPETVDVITVGQEFVTDGVAVAPTFEEVMQ